MGAARHGDEQEGLDAWSAAHGSIDPRSSFWIAGWLSIIHRLTAPLARRRVRPGYVTLAGLVVAILVPAFATAGAGWPLVSTGFVVLTGVLDGIDGALARMTHSQSTWGTVIDTVADRCSDVLFLSALWLLGAPALLCIVAVVATVLLESARSAAGQGGVEVVVLTVWERPSRVILTAFSTGLCGLAWFTTELTALNPRSVQAVATVGASIAVLLAVVALGHLLIVLHRTLGRPPVTPDRSGS